MRILKKGNLYAYTYIFECAICGCIFECRKDEVKTESDMYSCNCPTCREKCYGQKIRSIEEEDDEHEQLRESLGWDVGAPISDAEISALLS